MEEYVVKVYNNRTEWHQNEKLHRHNGPAVEFNNGDRCWYFEGIQYSEMEFNKKFNLAFAPMCKNDMGYFYSVEFSDEKKYWFYKGNTYTEEEFNKIRYSILN